MFARFDENPAMTLRVIKETKRYGRTDGRTDGQTHGRTDARTDGRTDNVKTVYPLQTKFAGGIKRCGKRTLNQSSSSQELEPRATATSAGSALMSKSDTGISTLLCISVM